MDKIDAVILVDSFSLGSIIILNRIIDHSSLNIKGIIDLDFINSPKKGGLKRLRKVVQKSGLIFAMHIVREFFLQKSLFFYARVFKKGKRKLYDVEELTKKYNLAMHSVYDINEQEELIKELKPELLISLGFQQILKKNIISIPGLCINWHPGWLPKFRGMKCYFWTLLNNEEEAGATIHVIDEGIDTGSILHRKKILINPKDSMTCAMIKTAKLGGNLMRGVLDKLHMNKLKFKSVDISKEEGNLYRMPKPEDIKTFKKRRSLLKIKSYIDEFF